jgi:lysozyme family protein
MSFPDSLAMVLQFEGGFVDNPDDPGGATNQGVTQAVYDRWRTEHGVPAQSVRLILPNEVAAIYQTEYWLPAHCNVLTPPLDAVVFDCAVNSGEGRAIRTLQQALQLTDDGAWGPETQAAALACDPRAVASRYLDLRDIFYNAVARARPQSLEFLRGWLNRIAEERAKLDVA